MRQKLDKLSIQFVKGVGPARAKLFENLGIQTIEDIFYFFPRRYEDRTALTSIAQAKVGEWQTITGFVVKQASRKTWQTKKHLTDIILDDGSGRMVCSWFNQPYLQNYFKAGKRVICYGKVDVYNNRLQMVAPEYEILEKADESLSTGRIVPIYPLTKGVSQRYLRKIIYSCLEQFKDDIRDELPIDLRKKYKLLDIQESIQALHFPNALKDQGAAHKRVSFEEFYFFQLAIIQRRLSITLKKGFAHKVPSSLGLRFLKGFPFSLTTAQKKVIREIQADMKLSRPMLRLLQGDVGSGKTVTALFGCIAAYENGYQSAFMAPTEILARQHYESVQKLLKGGPFKKLRTGLLVSALKKDEKEKILADLADGRIDLIFGTHALISENVQFKKLTFIVVDEQHKFGVRQRALLSEKGLNPDVLIMTATPIPRTLCITLYGDLDISIIDQMPKGRGCIDTQHFNSEEADQAYHLVTEKVAKGQQAYIVYPLIEESEKLDLKAAQEMFQQLSQNEFKEFKMALVHGRMKTKDTQSVMQDFKANKIQILVATTVVEVGVDVPNASVMVIEHAERFGLAQLHQLRGRVGRGVHDSYCLLIGNPRTEEGRARLEAIVSTSNGFLIAEKDLEIRGPGHFFGRHQHGFHELRVANPAKQLDVLEDARKEVKALEVLDPDLSDPKHRHLKKVIRKRYPSYLSMVSAG